MLPRRSLKWPIIIAIATISLLIPLIVGWVIVLVLAALNRQDNAPVYWVLLAVGTTFFVLILVGVIFHLTLSIKAINLTQRQANFVDSVTHELKSPIASLKLYLQTLRRRPVAEDERGEFYQFMLDDVERLDSLINHMLDTARLERKPQGDEVEDVELASMIEQCSELIRLRYRVSPDVISVDATPCIARAQKVDLELVFCNLIDNAVKYSSEKPVVEVVLQPVKEGMATVLISDNGPGIPRSLRRKIFGQFVRLGTELERNQPGTGLGLHIVRTLVKRLKGRIKVKDKEKGNGTVFEVQIPAVPVRESEADDMTTDATVKRAAG